jgi:hypothetical protein
MIMAEASEKELSDIELCYKAMGLSFSDNPEVVERTYRKLKDEYGKAMRTGDPNAAMNLKQLEELFTTITNSLIYKDYAREYEKYKANKADELAARKQKQAEKQPVKEALVNCPYCHKLIAPNLKVCLYCRGKILTPMEQLMEKFFSKRNVIIIAVVLVVIVLAAVLLMNPQLMK